MANIKWKERFTQVYEDSGVKDKYNVFKGRMSNVAEKLNIPSLDEVKGRYNTMIQNAQGNEPMSPGPLNKMLKDRIDRGNEAELQEIVNQSKETVVLDEFDNM